MEFTSSSIRHRGNRNKAILMRERREQLKQKRTAGYRRCGRVSSKEVGQEWVQDKSNVMVIIGSEALSLYPSLTKEESANEVAEAVLERSIRWEGVNWKEAVQFLYWEGMKHGAGVVD